MREIVLACLLFWTSLAGAQRRGGVVVSIVDEAGRPVSRAFVTSDSISRFTNERGIIVLGSAVRWPHRLIVKRIGLVPIDTVLIEPADSVRLVMRRLAMSLALVRVKNDDCRGQAVTTSVALRILVERVTENAERYRLLATQYPFELTLERRFGPRKADWKINNKIINIDTVTYASRTKSEYAPGEAIINESIPANGVEGMIAIPDLTDLADSTFMKSHCFRFIGREVIGTDSVVRMDFVPSSVLKGPDVAGSVYLRATDYQLVRVEFHLSTIPARLAGDLISASVTTDFREIAPGVAVVGQVDSRLHWTPGPGLQPGRGRALRSGETEQLLGIRWLKERP